MLELTGSHERGMSVTGWIDGQTQARITYLGTEADGTDPQTYEIIRTTERDTLGSLGNIDHYVNLELVSARLEPLGTVLEPAEPEAG